MRAHKSRPTGSQSSGSQTGIHTRATVLEGLPYCLIVGSKSESESVARELDEVVVDGSNMRVRMAFAK